MLKLTKDCEILCDKMSEAGDTKVESSLMLEDFKLSKILFNNAAKRTICLLGTFSASETDQGIVLIEKVEFAEENFTTENEEDSILKHTALETVLVNDIYSNFMGIAEQKFNSEFGVLLSILLLITLKL